MKERWLDTQVKIDATKMNLKCYRPGRIRKREILAHVWY